MRITSNLNLVFAFVGAVGLAGSAWAHPERDHAVPPAREGTPPPHVMRTEIVLHAPEDGRGDTRSRDATSANETRAFTTPDRQHVDGRMDAPRPFALPLRSDIKNRVQLRDDGEDPKAAALRNETTSHKNGGADTYREPSRVAPIPIKTDIALKLESGDESLIKAAVRPDDKRAARQRTHSVEAQLRNTIGDASQAELRDPRKYPGRNEDVRTPAQSASKVQLSRGGHAGDSANEPTR